MFKEANTGSNLPAQIDLYATQGSEYNFQVHGLTPFAPLNRVASYPTVVALRWVVSSAPAHIPSSLSSLRFVLQFIAKGGGSANKTFLFQQTKALLNEKSLEAFLEEKIKTLGTAGRAPRQRCLARCPLHCLPHHGGS